MQLVKQISDLKPYELISTLEDNYMVIGTSGIYTAEVVNINTGEESTIEGDYLEKGELENVYTKGNYQEYISAGKCGEPYISKLTKIANDIKEFYYS